MLKEGKISFSCEFPAPESSSLLDSPTLLTDREQPAISIAVGPAEDCDDDDVRVAGRLDESE